MPELVVIGDINVDVLMPVKKFPELEKEVSAESLTLTPGGNGCNSALAAGKLGIDTGFISKFGDDLFGGFLKQHLEKYNVDYSKSKIREENVSGATSALIMEGGKRAFVSFKGSAAHLSKDEIDWDYVKSAKGVLFSGFYHVRSLREDLGEVCKKAKELGVKVFLDTTFDPLGKWEDLYPALPYIDYLFVGCEGEEIAGTSDPEKIAKFFLEKGSNLVIVKRGDEGSHIFSDSIEDHLPAFDVDVVDGTGCGDAFVSGVVYGILSGMQIKEAHKFGAAAGAITATGFGTTSQPKAEDVKAFLSENC